MSDAGEHPLPDLYARWARELLGADPPGEVLSTCEDCAMCVKPSGELPTSMYFFDAEVKCCVYMPRLPNFLVGRVLGEDEGDPGRRTIEARLEGKVGVNPLGLGRPPDWDLLFRNSVNAIGRSRALRCPHFLDEGGGRCGIYRHRDSTCSTWFCRHERGAIGAHFWRALRQLLSSVEVELARWCALEEGLAPSQLESLLPRTPDEDHVPPDKVQAIGFDGEVDETTYAAQWGAWAGKERAFFRACAERVEPLRWEEIAALCGTDVRARAGILAKRHADLNETALPEVLVTGQLSIVGTRPEGVRAITYSSLDAVDMPSQLVALLPVFDGRPLSEVLTKLKEAHGVEIDPGFLRRLVDWNVLVPPRSTPYLGPPYEG